MVQWADTCVLKRHLPMHAEQGYKVIKPHMPNPGKTCWKNSMP